MNKDKLIDSIGNLDEDMIQGVQKLRKKPVGWTKWVAAAACVCLIAAAATLLPKLLPDASAAPQGDRISFDPPAPTYIPETTAPPAEIPRIPWTVHFNEASTMLSANKANIKAIFTEALTDAELSFLIPTDALTCSGQAIFDNFGNLLDIMLVTDTSLPGSPVTVALADYWFGFDYAVPGEDVVSACNGVDYKVYQYATENFVFLTASAIINDIYFFFSMDVSPADLEQAKVDFQYVLECFACYEDGKPDLSLILPDEIPELEETIFNTLAEARKEKDFGKYLPSQLPAGFEEQTIRRFAFHTQDYLSGNWYQALNGLDWVIKPYTQEDGDRLTRVEEKENYDLSLYPIPRADSVPDELREIVNDPIFDAEELTLEAVYCRAYKIEDEGDSDGWRMNFSVKYGDVLVSVGAKGVDPEWVYQQLMALKEK